LLTRIGELPSASAIFDLNASVTAGGLGMALVLPSSLVKRR